MNAFPGNPRVAPPADDDDAMREYGRQLAMDSLLQMLFGSGSASPGQGIVRRTTRPMANRWTQVALLSAALAASLAIGVVLWTMTRPAALPARREVVRMERPGNKPRPEPNQPSKPPEPPLAPFSASSGTVESPHDVPLQNTGPTMVELLATHETLAVFKGLEYRVCSGLTPPCPLQCDHSGKFAKFQISKYLKHASASPYGDPKQEAFVARLSDHDTRPVADPQILRTARGLRIGDYVLLTWEHRQLTTDGVSSPERLVVKLKRLSREKAEAMLTSEKRTQDRSKR
ncbi:MAG: hypothetical protein ACOY3P_18970 [Planctomycetota bacterium]